MGFSRQEYWNGVPLPSLKQHVSSLVLKSLLIVNFSKLFLLGFLWGNLKLCLSMLLPTLSTLSLTVIKSSLLQPWVPRTEDSFSSQETQQNHCFNPGAKDWGFLLESRDTTEHDVLERNSRSKSRGNSGKFLRGRKAGGSFHWIRVSMSNHEALRALTPCEYHRNHIFFLLGSRR